MLKCSVKSVHVTRHYRQLLHAETRSLLRSRSANDAAVAARSPYHTLKGVRTTTPVHGAVTRLRTHLPLVSEHLSYRQDGLESKRNKCIICSRPVKIKRLVILQTPPRPPTTPISVPQTMPQTHKSRHLKEIIFIYEDHALGQALLEERAVHGRVKAGLANGTAYDVAQSNGHDVLESNIKPRHRARGTAQKTQRQEEHVGNLARGAFESIDDGQRNTGECRQEKIGDESTHEAEFV